jgi:hypothetical protein
MDGQKEKLGRESRRAETLGATKIQAAVRRKVAQSNTQKKRKAAALK